MLRLQFMRIVQEEIRQLRSFHHNLHALPTLLDDDGGAGWEKIGDVGGIAWIGGRTDELAIDGIDVDAVGGRCVFEGFYGLTSEGNDVLEGIPRRLCLVGFEGIGGHMKCRIVNIGILEGPIGCLGH